MDGALNFIQDKIVRAAGNEGNGLLSGHGLDARDLYVAGAGGVDLLDEVGGTELVLGERLDIGDGLAAEGLADEFDFLTLDILDGQDLDAGEEVGGEFVDGVAEDGLLDENDVALGLCDLLDHVEKVGSLFLEDLVHLSVIVDDDLVFHLHGISMGVDGIGG